MKHLLGCALVGLTLTLATTSPASAEVIRFRFVPANDKGNTTPIPIGPGGSLGVRTSYRGATQPCPQLKRPTHLVAVVHPYSRRTLIVPLSLPEDTPRIEHRPDRIVYNYGTYTVSLRFLPDGSVETIYNSGLLRPVW